MPLNDAGADQGPVGEKHIGDREPSFVLVYVNRQSVKNPGYKLNSDQPYVDFTKIILPLREY